MINRLEIEIILPVYNEEKILEENTLKVKEFLDEYNFKFIISIVDNGSTDKTFKTAKNLEERFYNILAFKLKEKGRGQALRFRILNSTSLLIGYMDIDLSTDILDFLKMYKEILNGYDIIIGSRLLAISSVERSFTRRCLSRIYSRLVRDMFNLPFFDYQCGFKLFKRESILPVIPLIKNNNWFFDTELIFYAYKKGLKIKEIPVIWCERKRGKVQLLPTVIEDVKGIARLKFNNEL